jgi:hypothetical protein
MNKLTRACLLVVALLALAGLAAAESHPRHHFNLGDVDGRYVSAENAADTSSVHNFTPPGESDGGLIGPPVPFATAEVMVADGNGNVCGEADGYYSGITAPGVNLGPSLYHGTYTVDPADGRITILTCSDGTPSPTNKFCATSTPCATVTKTQVGYLQAADAGGKIVTVEQVFGDPNLSPGFLLHKHEWTKSDDRDRGNDRH